MPAKRKRKTKTAKRKTKKNEMENENIVYYDSKVFNKLLCLLNVVKFVDGDLIKAQVNVSRESFLKKFPLLTYFDIISGMEIFANWLQKNMECKDNIDCFLLVCELNRDSLLDLKFEQTVLA